MKLFGFSVSAYWFLLILWPASYLGSSPTFASYYSWYVATARIISHETWQYLNGIVGIGDWVNFAIALKGCADCRAAISSEMVNRDDVYLMLMGYTLEDLAKCIIAYRAYNTKPITKPEGIIPFEEKLKTLTFRLDNGETCSIKTHDLDKLYKAGDIGFAITDTERDHLKAISRYTLWKGRLPPSETIIS